MEDKLRAYIEQRLKELIHEFANTRKPKEQQVLAGKIEAFNDVLRLLNKS